MEVNGYPKQPVHKLSSKYLPLQYKEMYRGLEQPEGESMTEFSFLGELSLKYVRSETPNVQWGE